MAAMSPLQAFYTSTQTNAAQGNGGLIPQQKFAVSNFLGTPVPQVGNSQANPNYAAGVASGVNPMHVVIIALVLVVAGYAVHHFTFEK